ncbi:MAG: methionyl-tRNA formyltransferase [Bacteroidales bacterium]|nr:methionyl-tRNA formyltransferase [Bacteroidales bacterium]
MKNLRIVFMGTPEFAVATLGSLLMNGLNVVGVVTAPDKPAGRGKKITKSAVGEFAEFHTIPVMQPENLKDEDFIRSLQNLKADIFIVVAFRMLPEVVWKMPPMGTINLHASLLPDYRGAAPINRAIMNGESVTGVTTFLIDDKIDTGRILLRQVIPIFSFENAGDLHDRLMKYGARLVTDTISALAEKRLEPRLQSDFMKPGDIIKTAPKILPADCIIDWNNDAVKIHNQIRGLAPYPGAKSFLKKGAETITFKVLESQPVMTSRKLKPGSIISDGKSFLKVACLNGAVDVLNIQLEGKKRMYVDEFLRGYRINNYSVAVN